MSKESFRNLGAAIMLSVSSVGITDNPQVPQADLVGVMNPPHELQANKEVPSHPGNRVPVKKAVIQLRRRD